MSKERKEYRKKLENVPEELKALPNWVCYRLESRDGQPKPTKVPYNPITGDHAKANDPSTWTDYETCVAAVECCEHDGIGFEFGSGYVGIDLDRCRDVETGQIDEWASDIIAHLDSYTEASPSGTGVHIICKGALPPGGRRIGPVEMYETARFFTVTGEHILGTALTVGERSAELWELHEALFPVEVPDNTSEPGAGPAPSPLTDAEIIQKASLAANGEKFKKLWAGDWQGDYTSQSEADEALCCHLAFWAGKDADRMDTLFRGSGLYRKKWERNDYRCETISRAINRTAETYTMSRRERVEKLYTSLAGQRSHDVQDAQAHTPVNPSAPANQEQLPAPPPDFSDFRYSLTDLGNSERFIRQHAHDLRYCVETKTWHRWNGSRWEPDALNQVLQLAKRTVRNIYDELALEPDPDKQKALFKFIQRSESERSLNALVNLAKADPRIAVRVAVFDTQPHLLNCLNGTIDLRTAELMPHRREDLITKQCPVVYDPGATSALWENFLNDCTGGDGELQGFLQRAVGYTLYGDPREQVILMVNGPGGTGKSTFISVIQSILGDYAATADFSTFLKKDRISGGASDDVASLAGARLVSSIEVDQGQKLAEALVKQMTGGDLIRARFLYKSSFEFRPQFTLWLVCNHAPVVNHDDDAIWRRILRLPFENVIPAEKRDKNLKATLTDLTTIGPAILAWAVQGCVERYKNGLQVPTSVQLATDAYKATSNPLADFVEDACVLHEATFTTAADLRHAYDSWCRENGEKATLNRNQFTKALEDLGGRPKAKREGRGWQGVGLREDARSLYLAVKPQGRGVFGDD